MTQTRKVKSKPIPEPDGLRAFYQQAVVREWFRAHGARGGKVGGVIRTSTMTPEERKALARKAARARWAQPRRAKQK